MPFQRKSGHRLGLLALLVAALAAGAPAASADEAAPMYTADTVVAIDLTLSEAAIAELDDKPFEYVPATFSLAWTDGTPAGIGAYSTPLQVGLRLKGNLGASFEDLDGKSAFKVKFDEFVEGQTFLGLEKMTLNNMVQDRSMQHEALAYRAFREAGVPAPRTGYAFVRVNGEPYGLYLNLESLDAIALGRIFGAPFQNPPQHLYEAGYGFDVYPGEAHRFEVDEGKSKTRTDLEALIDAVNSSGPESWADRVAAYADLEEMTRMWAVEKYIGHWDGYAGVEVVAGPNLYRPNNYYLYSEPSGRFQMIPWGTDQTWEETIDFDARDGLMFDLCLEDAVCREIFRTAVLDLLTQFESGHYEQLAAETAVLLEPWQEIDPRKPDTQEEIGNAVEGIAYFISKRLIDAEEWLGIGPPAPPKQMDQPAAPVSTISPAPSPAPAQPAPGPRWEIGRISFAGAALRSRLTLAVPGLVTQLGTISTRRGPVTICRGEAEVDGGRSLSLSCEFNSSARERLERRWLRVNLVTRFDPADGPPESAARLFTVPRRAAASLDG